MLRILEQALDLNSSKLALNPYTSKLPYPPCSVGYRRVSEVTPSQVHVYSHSVQHGNSSGGWLRREHSPVTVPSKTLHKSKMYSAPFSDERVPI